MRLSNAHRLVLTMLADGQRSGRDLRAQMNVGKWWWQKWSSPAFYCLMVELVDARLIYEFNRNELIGDQVFPTRTYELSVFGKKQLSPERPAPR